MWCENKTIAQLPTSRVAMRPNCVVFKSSHLSGFNRG
jgi:hypothetical protein